MTTPTSSFDRRQTERAEVSLAVEVKDARGFSLHSSRDISVGGVFFDRAIPHAVGSQVELTFTLPGDSTAIRCRGEVVNVPDAKQYGMGVRFIGLLPSDAAKLQQFITQETGGVT